MGKRHAVLRVAKNIVDLGTVLEFWGPANRLLAGAKVLKHLRKDRLMGSCIRIWGFMIASVGSSPHGVCVVSCR